MIQQRSTVHQTYYDARERRVRQRPVRQFARLKFDTKVMAFKVPQKRSKWGRLVDIVFRRAA